MFVLPFETDIDEKVHWPSLHLSDYSCHSSSHPLSDSPKTLVVGKAGPSLDGSSLEP